MDGDAERDREEARPRKLARDCRDEEVLARVSLVDLKFEGLVSRL